MGRYPAARFTAGVCVFLGYVILLVALAMAILAVLDKSMGQAVMIAAAGSAIAVFQIATGQVLHAVLDGVENTFSMTSTLTALQTDVRAAVAKLAASPAGTPYQPLASAAPVPSDKERLSSVLAGAAPQTAEECRVALEACGCRLVTLSDSRWDIESPGGKAYAYSLEELLKRTAETIRYAMNKQRVKA